MRSRRHGSFFHAGLVATAALAACAPPRVPVELTPHDLQRASSRGEVLVLARFHRADTGEGIFVGGQTASVPAMVTRMEDGRTQRFGTTTAWSPAGARGWVLQALPPGSWYMTLGGGNQQNDGRAFTFMVPAGGGPAYVGSFPFDCPYTVAQPCQAIGTPRAEPAAERPALPEGTSPATTRLAVRFDRRSAAAGWPAPSSITAGINSVAVQSAINWEDLVSRAGSRGMMYIAGGFARIGASAVEGGREVGIIVGAPFFAAALGSVAIGALAAGAEGLHTAVVVREWQPCLEGLNAQTAPAAIGARFAEALALPAASRRATAGGAAPWTAEVTRVVLRRCNEAGQYGVEVATRWTAPGREARFLRDIPNAPDLRGLVFPDRMPWEAEAGGPATCRPLAEYCQAQAGALVTDAVVEAVTAARDALLAGR
ncbi:hypothetical protein [Roseomonas sp. HF4]|uniref:hypothetical protein n=1 Tax=Roseomonas sp. HF4 TaxID=2562313 RepID=UPI0010C0840C|nr:hypothetical protein [Roseomonas sp. HF4]